MDFLVAHSGTRTNLEVGFLAGGFTGCIASVFYGGREYRLATYRGARVEEWSPSGLVIRQGKYRLEAELLKAQGQALRAPEEGGMRRTIHESLCGDVRYGFWRGRDLVFRHADRCASFEHSGKMCAYGKTCPDEESGREIFRSIS